MLIQSMEPRLLMMLLISNLITWFSCRIPTVRAGGMGDGARFQRSGRWNWSIKLIIKMSKPKVFSGCNRRTLQNTLKSSAFANTKMVIIILIYLIKVHMASYLCLSKGLEITNLQFYRIIQNKLTNNHHIVLCQEVKSREKVQQKTHTKMWRYLWQRWKGGS